MALTGPTGESFSTLPGVQRRALRTAGGEAAVTNWELIYRHQVHLIGLNIGVLAQAAPQIFGEVMGELFALIAAGVLTPGQPTAYELTDGPKALAELETRATAGKLALLP
jgi:NADPH2:quinone reductase